MRKINIPILITILFFLLMIDVDARNLESGNYIITSALDNNKVVDLAYGSIKNGSNVQLYDSNRSMAQQWKFKKNKNGYYTISSSKNNNYVLDVNSAIFTNSSNVQLYKNNNTKAQQWKLVEDKYGYYTIVSYNEKYVLDINSANTSNGSNIQIYENNRSDAQKFIINKVVKKEKSIDNGIYNISTYDDKYNIDISNNLENGAEIGINEKKDIKTQKWYIEYLNNGTYSIRNLNNYKYSLDVYHASKLKNTKIQLFNYNESSAQQWIIKKTDNNYYKIASDVNGLFIDLKDSKIQNNNNVILNYDNDNNSQKFKFTKIANYGDNNIADGNYIITSALSNNKVIDLAYGSIKNSNNIQLYDNNNSKAQEWYFKQDEYGYYTISTSRNHDYVLDVNSANFSNATNIQLYKKNNTNAQRWQLLEDENGYYSIVSYDERYVVDVNCASTANGAKIQLYRNNGSNAQKFAINKVVSGENILKDGIYSIETKNNDYAIDIYNSNISNSSNIVVNKRENKDSQKWYIKSIGNGYYTITSIINTNYSLDVYHSNKTKNTNVQLFNFNNGDGQKWIIKKVDDNYYKIISKTSGLNIDIENENLTDNANILMNVETNSDSQLFKFNKIENFGDQTIKDGYYFINSKINIKKSLDVTSNIMSENTNVQLYDSNSTIAQKWYIKYIGDGYYSILCNADSNYSLTSLSDKSSNVQINTYNNLSTQKWIIKDNKNGYYSILNNNYLSIDISGANTTNGTNVQLYNTNASNAQQFKLIPTAEGISQNIISDGYYFINSALDNNYVLDLNSANISNGNNIQLYYQNSSKAQKWYVKYIGYGYYKISSAISNNKLLNVENTQTSEANVQIYDSNNSYNQEWIIKDAGDGYFYIISNFNGIYLDVDNQIATNSSNVKAKPYTGNISQKFKLTKTRLENLVIDVSAHQGQIDWNQVKNSGIYGVILRISAGCDYEDSMFSQYISEVKRLGIPYGIYIFSYAENYNEGVLYGNFTKNIINKYNLNPTLGIYLDLENTPITNYMGTNEYTQVVQGYMSIMPNAKIYCDLNHANGVLNTDYIRPYITWIAQWSSQCSYTNFYKMWQFSSNGSIPGINGRVDLSYYYLD